MYAKDASPQMSSLLTILMNKKKAIINIVLLEKDGTGKCIDVEECTQLQHTLCCVNALWRCKSEGFRDQ